MKLNRKSVLFAILTGLILGMGCANQSVQDFNAKQAAEEEAKAAREKAKWNGILKSQKGDSIAAISIDIKQSVRGEANNQGVQQVGLSGTITIQPPVGRPLQHGFSGGFYDSTNRVFHISTEVRRVDGSQSTIELHGSFSDQRMTGEIWAGQFGEAYQGMIDLARNGPLPISSALTSDLTAAGNPSQETLRFLATIPNPLDREHPTQQMAMTFQSDPDPGLRFLQYFEPVMYVTVRVHYVNNPMRYVMYRNIQIDPRSKPATFTGLPDGQTAFCTLTCTDDLARGWQCSLCDNLSPHFSPDTTGALK